MAKLEVSAVLNFSTQQMKINFHSYKEFVDYLFLISLELVEYIRE
ncbi:6503_t:CDS:2 [Ambispora leptoticha]|uniref:6503_t:CDS:1 n=1 Tax=Ambispora leptoticha TaxID=144679 RepID=A0A9N9FWJ9_9GLOM|nr:6503_t:CDS:2 [Ambispora leptoticha]